MNIAAPIAPVTPAAASRDRLTLVAMSLAAFVTAFGAHMVAANISLFAADHGAALLEVGLIIGAYEVAEVFLKAPFGLLSDRIGRVRVLVAGLLFFVLASATFALSARAELILLARLLQGIGAAAFSPASAAIVGTLRRDKGLAFGYYGSLKGLGYATGPVMGALVSGLWGFQAMFWLTAAVGVVALSVVLSVVREQPGGVAARKKTTPLDLIYLLKRRDLWPAYAAMLVGMALFYSAVGFVPLYAAAPAGANAGNLGPATVAVFSAAYIFLQPVVGRWSDRHGRSGLLVGGLILSTLSIAAVPPMHTLWLIALVSATFGAGLAALTTVSYAIVADRVDQAELGTAMGVADTVREIGDAGGPVLFGALATAGGLAAGFWGLAILAAAVIPGVQLLRRNEAAPLPGAGV